MSQNGRHGRPIDPVLNEREIFIIRSIAQGWSTKRMAREVFVSPETIKSQTSTLMNKMGLKSAEQRTRSFIVHCAYSWRLLRPGDIPAPENPMLEAMVRKQQMLNNLLDRRPRDEYGRPIN